MKIELLDPASGITADPASIAADQSRTEVVARVTPSTTPRTLTFRALGEMTGDVQVISEASVLVKFSD